MVYIRCVVFFLMALNIVEFLGRRKKKKIRKLNIAGLHFKELPEYRGENFSNPPSCHLCFAMSAVLMLDDMAVSETTQTSHRVA